MATEKTIGVFGGSGLYEMEGLTDISEISIDTPFGKPSDSIVSGRIGGTRLLFLPRHGRGHVMNPSRVPYRANVHAMKQLGATAIISVSAVGSMREDIAPGHLVVPDQLIDRTRQRESSFYDDGVSVHVAFADPYCAGLRALVLESARRTGAVVHDGGTYVCMEGPAFSTRAESHLYRSWGVSVIGMTNLPEAKLAREAEMCFATLALSTDYDCWHASEAAVTADAVLAVIAKNVAAARAVVRAAALAFHDDAACPCRRALDGAVLTAPDRLGPDQRRRYGLLLARALGGGR